MYLSLPRWGKQSVWLAAGNARRRKYDGVTKRSPCGRRRRAAPFAPVSGEWSLSGIRTRQGRPAPCVWPCEPLCAPIADGARPAPPGGFRPVLGRRFPFFGERALPLRALYGGRKEKQDKGRGRRWRLRPVTSARSAGSYREFPVYQKWGQNPACDIFSAVTIPKHLLPQQKNRGHTSLLRCERLLFRTGRPTSKITPHETKIEVLPGAGKCDA